LRRGATRPGSSPDSRLLGPADSAPAEVANYRDQRETAFGWHGGVEGGVQIVSRLSFMIRLTYHNIRSESGRSLLTANAGFVYRF
jgi:hypothetical protein